MLRRTTTHAQCSEICQINDNLLITHQQPCICPLSVLHSSAHNHSLCQHAGPKMVLTYTANNSLTYHDSRPTLITTLFNMSFSFCVQLISIVLRCLAMALHPISVVIMAPQGHLNSSVTNPHQWGPCSCHKVSP